MHQECTTPSLMHVLAIAGHVDHGKSTLVTRLTGVDPDRLAEEKARGLTIDLGFGVATLPSGAQISLIDVPGHIRFLKNMLAGVGAVEGCIFVVSAAEGWKAQSEEHLRILELLGVRHGVVALTRAASVDAERVERSRREVLERVDGTFLGSGEIIPVDAPRGSGIEGEGGLLAALDRLVASMPSPGDRDRPRLWIDRSFSVAGWGTVVTGTLSDGPLTVGEAISVVPGDAEGRIRRLESHGHSVEQARPGRRVAVNLAGLAHHAIRRGQALVRTGDWYHSSVFDASLSVLEGIGHEVSKRGAYVAYVGSGEYPVRLQILGGSQRINPGQTLFVRLWLPAKLPAVPGDRYILRDAGRRETIGGGEVLDVAPVLPAARAKPDRSITRVVAERGWVDVEDLERMTGHKSRATTGRWVVDPRALAMAASELMELVDNAEPEGLPLSLLDARQRAVLDTLPSLVSKDGLVRPESTDSEIPIYDSPEDSAYLSILRSNLFQPAPPIGVDSNELRRLARSDLAVEVNGVWFAREALDRVASVVTLLLQDHPDGFSVSELRVELETTRKYILPLLSLLDASGMTRRHGDLRTAGPRLVLSPHKVPQATDGTVTIEPDT
ncbi:MAG TPA: selenocysteine-specific translation elongation factor [Acidimicrobiales bacterium]|nr:selenocysteine-specific translation elongation factor [Acidimicrobiales bacterium]